MFLFPFDQQLVVHTYKINFAGYHSYRRPGGRTGYPAQVCQIPKRSECPVLYQGKLKSGSIDFE